MPRAGGRLFSLGDRTPRRSLSLVQRNDLIWIEADLLQPDPEQPRRDRPTQDDEDIRELAGDIAQNGILQPLAIRTPDPKTGMHTIIAGERRWTAGKLAGVDRFPCLIQDADPRRAFLMAFSENSQRKALTDMDTASALTRIRGEWDLATEEALAEFVHKSLSWVQRMLAAADLDPESRRLMAERRESVALAPHLRPQTPEQRKATLDAIAVLPTRDEKVKAVARINEKLRAGAPALEAIQAAVQPLARHGRTAVTSSGAPARLTLPFVWSEAKDGSQSLEVNTRALSMAQLMSGRRAYGWTWRRAVIDDVLAFRDACSGRENASTEWAEFVASMKQALDGAEPTEGAASKPA